MPSWVWHCYWHECDKPDTKLALVSTATAAEVWYAVYTGKLYRSTDRGWEMAYFRQEIAQP